jgi:hypothetical protein
LPRFVADYEIFQRHGESDKESSCRFSIFLAHSQNVWVIAFSLAEEECIFILLAAKERSKRTPGVRFKGSSLLEAYAFRQTPRRLVRQAFRSGFSYATAASLPRAHARKAG